MHLEEARLAVAALAGLHGPRWCDPAWLSFAGTVMPKADEATAGARRHHSPGRPDHPGSAGPRMDPADAATVLESADLIAAWLLGAPERFSLLHGDYRLDNLLFNPARTRVTVVDWQTLAVGLPARDLACFIATSLAPDDRALYERELVEIYHRALEGHGVRDYDAQTCWRDYCFGMLQVPLITTLGFAFSAATERGDDMVLAMLARGSRAIRELGTLGLIPAAVAPGWSVRAGVGRRTVGVGGNVGRTRPQRARGPRRGSIGLRSGRLRSARQSRSSSTIPAMANPITTTASGVLPVSMATTRAISPAMARIATAHPDSLLPVRPVMPTCGAVPACSADSTDLR